MIVTSMQLTLSSRRDIAVLQKESPSFWAKRMSIIVLPLGGERLNIVKILASALW
jgi:hypothetical protein